MTTNRNPSMQVRLAEQLTLTKETLTLTLTKERVLTPALLHEDSCPCRIITEIPEDL